MCITNEFMEFKEKLWLQALAILKHLASVDM